MTAVFKRAHRFTRQGGGMLKFGGSGAAELTETNKKIDRPGVTLELHDRPVRPFPEAGTEEL